MIDWSVGKSLVFHRWTENASRKWMFRVAWVQAYERLKGHMALTPEEFKPENNLNLATGKRRHLPLEDDNKIENLLSDSEKKLVGMSK